MHNENFELRLEDFSVKGGSKLDGCEIGQAKVRDQTGANIVGIRLKNGGLVVSPSAKTRLQDGDILMALGTSEQLTSLKRLSET